jgi:hypothetical protein
MMILLNGGGGGFLCGLNAPAHCSALWSLVAVERPSVVFLQETKLVAVQDSDILQLLGSSFEYFYLPSV